MKKKYYKKLKVGDIVQIKNNLKTHRAYGVPCFVKEMKEYLGQYKEIENIENSCIWFKDNEYTWSRQMLKNPRSGKVKEHKNAPLLITTTKKGYYYYTELRNKINEIITYLRDM